MKIKKIEAYEILASGGYPTVETLVTLENGTQERASVPYGASAGSHEATVLVDGDKTRYSGKGMLTAVDNVNNKIAPILLGMNALDQKEVDRRMIEFDGTENKENLGGNAILSVSVAVAKAAAKAQNLELYEHLVKAFDLDSDLERLPSPMAVAIEGGKHADNSTDLQEYCLTAVRSEPVTEQIRKVLEAYHAVKNVLIERELSTNVGNEGAFAPEGIDNNEVPLEILVEGIRKAGYEPGRDISLSIDAAASEFYADEKYNLKIEDKVLTSDEIIAYYEPWFKKYPIVSIEDMLAEDDWDAWTKINTIANENDILNIGDDLTVTNKKRLQLAIDKHAINSILIKLNQIGSVSETISTCILAKEHNMDTVISHRGGGETNDTAMVDVAVAVGSRFFKVGPTRGERVCKYNRLLSIERQVISKKL